MTSPNLNLLNVMALDIHEIEQNDGMRKMPLTKNQAAAVTALIKKCLREIGSEKIDDLINDPFTWVETSDLVDAGWSQKQAEGTFGSLIAEGIVCMEDNYYLAHNWDELRKYHA